MALRFRDSLSGRLRTLVLRRGLPATIYVCGPTVYDVAHVGHARTYLYFDLVRRALRDAGVPVRHVMNITDFEDKLDRRAQSLGVSWRTLARKEERRFRTDLADLDILSPSAWPRASAFVPEMVDLVKRLDRTGRVERRGDEWIYRPDDDNASRNFPIGTELERHAVREPGMAAPGTAKEPTEFMVWKRQESPSPSWPSPWGRGVPGWHLECFVMAERYVGLPVDLHGGGTDLIFPHHYAENELALALRNTAFARIFLHTGFVLDGSGVKMSKSKGNLVPIRSALQVASASALRWYLLSTPYQQRLSWNPEDLEQARDEYEFFAEACRSSVADGAGGTLSTDRLTCVARDVRDALCSNLAAHRALDRLRMWNQTLDRTRRARFRRGEAGKARELYQAIERMTGLKLVTRAAGPRSG